MQDIPDTLRYVSRGIAHVPLDKAPEPVTVSFVLMRQFTMLAFTSAIEPLRVANQLAGRVLFRWHVYSEYGQPDHLFQRRPRDARGAFAGPGPGRLCDDLRRGRTRSGLHPGPDRLGSRAMAARAHRGRALHRGLCPGPRRHP
jgi:hypothetical protein